MAYHMDQPPISIPNQWVTYSDMLLQILQFLKNISLFGLNFFLFGYSTGFPCSKISFNSKNLQNQLQAKFVNKTSIDSHFKVIKQL
jgi:hypothetical protein